MGVWIKTGGAWVEKSGRPHLKVNGSWMPVKEGHVKRAGVWTEFYNYDVTPPQPPQLLLEEVNPQYNYGGALRLGRYVNVSAAPAVVDDTLKRIVVLVNTNYQPSSPYDAASYISVAGAEAPGESWSELGYNGYLTSRPLTSVVTKRFTANQADSTVLPGGTYYFSAWAQDWAGNWSDGTYDSISLPTAFDVTQRSSHSYTARATLGGTYRVPTNNFVSGDMEYDISPMRHGVWFYGSQIQAAIAGAPINYEITSMQIHISRKSNDAASGNSGPLWLAPHPFLSGSHLQSTGAFIYSATNVGSIAKGEAKWFNVPQSWWAGFANGTYKGVAAVSRNPGMTSYVRGTLKNLSDAPRMGEIQLSWTSEASA